MAWVHLLGVELNISAIGSFIEPVFIFQVMYDQCQRFHLNSEGKNNTETLAWIFWFCLLMLSHALSNSIILLLYGLYNATLKKCIWVQETGIMGYFSHKKGGGDFFQSFNYVCMIYMSLGSHCSVVSIFMFRWWKGIAIFSIFKNFLYWK